MTSLQLLRHLGSARDEYIMEARKRPKKKFPAAKVVGIAAALVLVIGVSGTVLLSSWRSGSSAPETMEAGDGASFGEKESSTASQAESQLGGPSPAPAPGQANLEGEGGVIQDGMGDGEKTPLWGTLLAAAQYPESIADEDFEAQSAVWTANQVSDDTAYALNAFAYKTAAVILRDTDQAVSGCYSPLSLYQTLSVLASGAGGQTRDQLLSLLGQSDLDTLADQTGKLYRVNYFDNDINRLQIANSLWLDKEMEDGTPIEYDQEWVMSAAANYYADVYAADFSSEDTQKTLWEWIDTHTGGQLSYSSKNVNLDPNTVMAIVNTVWYKTQWADPFDEGATAADIFTTESGQEISCDFMRRTDEGGRCIETEEYTKSFLQLNQGRMIFVLPKEGVSLDSLLTEDKLWEIFENGDYSDAEVHWSVPKFETNASYHLEDAIKSLGISDAFDLNAADFSLMSDTTPLYLGSLQQGSRISVNEDGVEASSYSMAGMLAEAAEPEEKPVVEMNLNRPFLYLITANDGSTVFIGTVRSPES